MFYIFEMVMEIKMTYISDLGILSLPLFSLVTDIQQLDPIMTDSAIEHKVIRFLAV